MKIIKIIILFIFLWIMIMGSLYFWQEKLIFFPTSENFGLEYKNNFEEKLVTTKDGIKINTIFIDNKSQKTILFFHGNGGNISGLEWRIKFLNQFEYNLLLVDYRGYGKSQGFIKEEKDLYLDAEAVFEYLKKEQKFTEENIIIWGQSLGGSVAVHLAQNKKIPLLIIESSFYSMEEMMNNKYPFIPKFLLKYKFKSFEKIKNVSAKIIIAHSEQDLAIPFKQSKNIYKIISSDKKFIELKGGHNNAFLKSSDIYFKEIKKFLK